VTRGRYDLAGIGSMVADAIHRAPRILGPDEKGLLEPAPDGRPARRLVGGVVLNHLGWASLLGVRVAIFGKQARDADGRFLREGMSRLGIDHHLDLSGESSSCARVFVDPSGARAIYMSRGATGQVTPEEIDRLHRPVIESSSTVSTEISQLPLPAVRRVLEVAREVGARTVLDLDVPLDDAVPTLGTRDDLEAVLALVDVLKPSLAATRGLVATEEPKEIARELSRYGAEAVLITTGAGGCIVHVGGTAIEVAAFPTEVVDTTGAGDAFLGGVMAGLHHGLDWEDAARLGNACGAACCAQFGAFPDPTEPAFRRVLDLYGASGSAAIPVSAPSGAVSASPLDRFLEVAAAELGTVAQGLDRVALDRAASLVVESEAKGGRVHLTGVGKPEHVARYAAALLSSTGTPATFLHATEAVHGSVGQLRAGDVLVAISNSGSTDELLACVSAAKNAGARLVALCGDPASALARTAEIALIAAVSDEGGPLGLAPRASILAETFVLQALSVLLQGQKGLDVDDYRSRHPAGALGKKSARGSD
jgi:arabinose-5-phosphate isomerase